MAHDPFAELPDKDRVPRSSRMLDAWVNDAQKILGIRGGRVGWLLASTLVAAALQRETEDGTPLFLVKGGTYIERSLDLRARATKDLDTLYRGSGDDLEDRIDMSLARPWGEIQFSRTAVEVIETAPRARKPRRFKVNLDIRGVRCRSIQVEVSFDEGRAGDRPERMTAPATGFFGISHPDDLVTISMAYQVAQKLHACTDPHEPPTFRNERVRDIVDLILIRDAFYPDGTDLAPVKAAAEDVFDVRATEARQLGHAARSWPPTIVSNDAWRTTWHIPARQVGLTLSLNDAVDSLNNWIATIDSATRQLHTKDPKTAMKGPA